MQKFEVRSSLLANWHQKLWIEFRGEEQPFLYQLIFYLVFRYHAQVYKGTLF